MGVDFVNTKELNILNDILEYADALKGEFSRGEATNNRCCNRWFV